MLPVTKKLLEQDIERRRSAVVDITKQGASIWEGDQWHSTTFREQQRQRELAIRFLQMIDQKSGKIEVIHKPEQNTYIELGHMAKVKLLDDSEMIEARIPYSLVHILTSEDVLYIGKLFGNLNEIVVSYSSPIGGALLGKRRGEVTTYLQGSRIEVLDDIDAIEASNLFKR